MLYLGIVNIFIWLIMWQIYNATGNLASLEGKNLQTLKSLFAATKSQTAIYTRSSSPVCSARFRLRWFRSPGFSPYMKVAIFVCDFVLTNQS